jgi:hypothetical protein
MSRIVIGIKMKVCSSVRKLLPISEQCCTMSLGLVCFAAEWVSVNYLTKVWQQC